MDANRAAHSNIISLRDSMCMLQKSSFLILLVFLGVLIPSSALAERITYVIGASLPLSGRLSYIGEDIRRGLELAVEEFSSESVGFELKFEDNQHQGSMAATTAHKLLNIDNVNVLISLWDMADVIAPIAEQKRIPHLSIRWDPDVAERYSFTIAVESTYRSYIDKKVELLTTLGTKRIGVFTEEAKAWILASDYLKEIAGKSGLEIIGDERYSAINPDHRVIVTKLLGKNPDIVVLLSNPPHTEILVKRIREANRKQRFTGYFDYSEEPELFEGVPFAAQFAVAPWFEKLFREKFSSSMKARASHAYDIMKLLSVVHEGSPYKLSGVEIIERLSQIRDVEGASGNLNVTERKTIESDCVFKTVRDGKFIVISPTELRDEVTKLENK